MRVVALRRLGSRELHRPPPVGRVSVSALGFAGASEEDRQRWLAVYRRLLDSLEHPLQAVLSFVPGVGAGPAHGVAEHLPAPGERARLDAEFAEHLARDRSSQARYLEFATAPGAVAAVAAAIQDLGVKVRRIDERFGGLHGLELSDSLVTSDGSHERTWYVERFPGTELEPGWLFRLVPPGSQVRLSWHARPLPSAWVVAFLQRQLVNMRAARMQESEVGNVDPLLRGAMPAAEELQRRLTASEERAFHVSLYLTLVAPSRDQLEADSERLHACAQASLCSLRMCRFRMLDGSLATQPVALDRLERQHVLDTSSLATLFPWHDAELRHPGGMLVGRSGATGMPVVIDPFDDRQFANANIGVFGHSGAGKTYLLSTVAMSALSRGTQVFVIDPEHEYGALAKLLGGVDVNLALGSGHALNVLGLRPTETLDEASLGPAVADTVDLAAVICGDLDESERAVVEVAVRDAYSDVADPVLGDVAARLPPESRAGRILRRWSAGSLGAMFSAHTNVDLDAPIVAFGMRELREELVAPVHFLLAESLWRRIKERGRRRLLIVDELGLLFEDATIRRFVVRLARRIRKYDGALVFATQNPGDLLSSEAGAVVATNPAIHFFGAQRAGEAAKLKQVFRLSDSQRTFLETARRGNFLISAGHERLAVRVQAPPWQVAAMEAARERPASNL